MQDVRSSDLSRIAQDLQIRKVQVEKVLQLLDEGHTVPFISCYRKENTGNLDEELLRTIKKRLESVRQLAKRKQTIIKSIEGQGKLTPYLRTAILKAESDKRLDDLYLPFKPKSPSLASLARDRGLGELADAIWNRDAAVANLEEVLPTFVNPEKGIQSDIDVLTGVQHILGERFAETAAVRASVRGYLWEAGKISSTKKEHVSAAKAAEFKDFFKFSEPVRRIPPHRILALNRGEKDGLLEIALDCNTEKLQQIAIRSLADFAQKEASALKRGQTNDEPHDTAQEEETKLPQQSDVAETSGDATEAPPGDSEQALPIESPQAPVESEPTPPSESPETPAEQHSADAATQPAHDSATDQPPNHVNPSGSEQPIRPLIVEEGDQLSPQSSYRTPHAVFLRTVMTDALKRLLVAEMQAEIRTELTELAERHAIDVFARNLRSMLLQPPIRNRRILAIDPAYRGPGQVAVLDEDGGLIDNAVIYPYAPPKKTKKAKPKKDVASTTSAPPAEQTTADGQISTATPAVPTEGVEASSVVSDAQPEPAQPSTNPAVDTESSIEQPMSHSSEGAVEETTPPPQETAISEENVPPNGSNAKAANEPPPTNVSGGQPTDNEIDAKDETATSTEIEPKGDSPDESMPSTENDATDDTLKTPAPESKPNETSAASEEPAAAPVEESVVADEVKPVETAVSEEPAAAPVEKSAVADTSKGDETTAVSEPAAAPVEESVVADEVKPDYRALAKAALREIIAKHQIDLLAIGNGNGCRDMEELVSELIEESASNLEYVLVNEAGVSVYAVSSIAREELPQANNNLRCAVSIGRRLQDPLAELVKVDPPGVGVGLYQHDVNKRELKESLEEVVESCVNHVGADLNRASISLLRHVAGLNPMSARELVEFAKKNGPFHSREQLLQNTGIGEARFKQAAGFLRIYGGSNPLDRTSIHPESYAAAEQILAELGFPVDAVFDQSKHEELTNKLQQVTPREIGQRMNIGVHTVLGILDALANPYRDVRDDVPPPIFKKGVIKLDDLKPGMKLRGIVLNVVDFGTFVDIGLKDSGLVHISQMANRYIKSPYEVASVNDVVDVWVLNIDQDRHRVSLTMIEPGSEPEPQSRGKFAKSRSPRGKRREKPEKGQPKKAAEPSPPKVSEPSPTTEPHPATEPSPPPTSEPQQSSEPSQAKPDSAVASKPQSKQNPSPPPRPMRPKPRPHRKKRAAPKPKLSKDALEGKVPMRSFGELSVFFSKQDEPESQQSAGEEQKAQPNEPSETNTESPSSDVVRPNEAHTELPDNAPVETTNDSEQKPE